MAKLIMNTNERSPFFSKLCEQSSLLGEKNDCTVKAIALVAGMEYEAAHSLLKQLGRKNKKGFNLSEALPAISEKTGVNFVEVNPREIIDTYPAHHVGLGSITTHHPARFHEVWKNGKKYLAFTSGHVAAIMDGKTHDWTEGRAMMVKKLYEVK